jgi:hypothetical protein
MITSGPMLHGFLNYLYNLKLYTKFSNRKEEEEKYIILENTKQDKNFIFLKVMKKKNT